MKLSICKNQIMFSIVYMHIFVMFTKLIKKTIEIKKLYNIFKNNTNNEKSSLLIIFINSNHEVHEKYISLYFHLYYNPEVVYHHPFVYD